MKINKKLKGAISNVPTSAVATKGSLANVKKLEAKLGVKSVSQPIKTANKLGKGAKKNKL